MELERFEWKPYRTPMEQLLLLGRIMIGGFESSVLASSDKVWFSDRVDDNPAQGWDS